jgi:hypothetical protein
MVYSQLNNIVDVGSVGLPIREIKDNLEFYNRLAQNHDCILLLDNGDELLRGYVKKDTYLSQINFGKAPKFLQ